MHEPSEKSLKIQLLNFNSSHQYMTVIFNVSTWKQTINNTFNTSIQFSLLIHTTTTKTSRFVTGTKTSFILLATLLQAYFKVTSVYWCLFNRKLQIFNFSEQKEQTSTNAFNPLMGTGNYSTTSNNMKLVH